MIRDDFLLRQIEKLAEMLVAQFRGGSDPREEESMSDALDEAQSLSALTPGAAARVPLPTLLSVLGSPERILRMGLLMAGEGENPGRSAQLIEAAVARDASLGTSVVLALRDELRLQVSEL